MSIDGVPLRPIKEINILSHYGGLGDSVARLPAVNYILEKYEHIQHVNLFVQDYFVEVAQLLLWRHAARLTVRGYSMLEGVLTSQPEDTPGMMCDNIHHTTLRSHLTDHAFHCLADEQVGSRHKRYLQFGFPKQGQGDYVVITTGFTSPTREWLPSSVNDTVDWIAEQGYKVKFLGKSTVEYWQSRGKTSTANFREAEIDFSKGEDLRDKTDLIEAARIMAQAKAVVGIDNGLLHLAACSSVPIIFGFTSVKPEHRLPYRQPGEITLSVLPDKECRFCQSKMGFVYKFDFRRCYTNTYKCVASMGARKFIEALREVL